MYELFVNENWSAFRIAKHFNQQGVDDWSGWSEHLIKQRLFSATSIGVFVWYKTRREYDHDTGKWVVVPNPGSEREVRYDPNLAIIPRELWCAARRKLAAMRSVSPITGKRRSRNQISATTLFSGSLFCHYCGQELQLYRSTSKYKQFFCLNGKLAAHNCQLSTSKSSRMVEECLLGYLRDRGFPRQRAHYGTARQLADAAGAGSTVAAADGPRRRQVPAPHRHGASPRAESHAGARRETGREAVDATTKEHA